LGLANLMTLVALVFLRFKEAVIVTFLRVVIGPILGGTFLGPTFFLSLAGGIATKLIMGVLYQAAKKSHEFDQYQHIRSLYAYS
jgi:heptaprenyl diphosphate synthase